jgi:Tfp pilus assembly protein PilV
MTPTPTARHRAGISIVEILIAVVMLAVGALAALGLQTSSLRASGTAESLQTLTRVAESELQFRRGIDRGGAALANAAQCRVLVPDGTTCTVVVEPCALVSGAATCTGIAAADATAHEVTVTTVGAQGREVVLTTLVATVASAATNGGGGDDGNADDPPADDPPADDPPADDPPADDPPAVDPPAVDPPAVDPPADDPPADAPVACVPRGNSGKCKK